MIVGHENAGGIAAVDNGRVHPVCRADVIAIGTARCQIISHYHFVGANGVIVSRVTAAAGCWTDCPLGGSSHSRPTLFGRKIFQEEDHAVADCQCEVLCRCVPAVSGDRQLAIDAVTHRSRRRRRYRVSIAGIVCRAAGTGDIAIAAIGIKDIQIGVEFGQ